MRVTMWMIALLATACTGKDDSAAGEAAGALCTSADLSTPDCESGQAVLFVHVTSGGAAAPSGTTVYVTDCDGVENREEADEFGDVRFSLPAATYLIRAENPGAGLSSTPSTHDIPGCQTTDVDVVL